MSADLSPTLQRTLDAIATFEAHCGYPPTARELGRVLGVQYGTAISHVLRLRDLGRVAWDARPGGREPGRVRVIEHERSLGATGD